MTMEDKMERTRKQLETLAADRLAERQQAEDGLVINDALRLDNELLQTVERKQCAEYVKSQMKEREARADAERRDRRGANGGYWGPEEKPIRSTKLQQQIRQELVAQMEVNQVRK